MEVKYDWLPVGLNRPGTPLQAVGLAVHETATPGATDENESRYFHNADRQASAHCFVDWDSVTWLIPENEVAWHAGATANHRFISMEICHATTPGQFAAVWDNACAVARDICTRHGWGPDRMWSHARISRVFGETDHTDPEGYFKEFGKTMDDFIRDTFNGSSINGGDDGMLIMATDSKGWVWAVHLGIRTKYHLSPPMWTLYKSAGVKDVGKVPDSLLANFKTVTE